MVFQKVYELRDYHFIKHLDCIKILDMCDMDWKDPEFQIKDTLDAVDAVTVSSEPLKQFLEQMTDKPVRVIKDRFEVKDLPAPRRIFKPSTNLVWFGYSHNAETLRQAIWSLEDKYRIDDQGEQLIDVPQPYKLTIIANSDPYVWQMATNPEKFQPKVSYIKYDSKTIRKDLNEFDAALLPKGSRPEDRFKSNNKTILANLCGLPVVTNKDELLALGDYKYRNDLAIRVQTEAIKEYNVKQSIIEMKELISELYERK